MLDQGKHDCCLELHNEHLCDVAIGNLIGFRDRQLNSHWKIGEIVWYKLVEDKTICVGIRLFGVESMPVGIDIPLHHEAYKNYTKGIFYLLKVH